jgi:2-hydroxychromene-2-carboxylate isomerase
VLKEPARFPQNGLKAARLALLGQQEDWGPEFTRRAYLANFAEQKDISDEGVLSGILSALDLDAGKLLARSNEPENKERLKSQTDEAIKRGIFGAPSFLVCDELFWGNDRLEAALLWAKR